MLVTLIGLSFAAAQVLWASTVSGKVVPGKAPADSQKRLDKSSSGPGFRVYCHPAQETVPVGAGVGAGVVGGLDVDGRFEEVDTALVDEGTDEEGLDEEGTDDEDDDVVICSEQAWGDQVLETEG